MKISCYSVSRSNMAHRYIYSFILVFFILKLGSIDAEEAKYCAGFSSGAISCKNFNNDNFNADDMNLAPMDSGDEDGAGAMCIEGSLEIHKPIDSGVMINMNIEKETDTGSEPMFSVQMDLCESLKDEDAPWKPIFAAMGIEGCPVEAGTYSVNNMTVDLSFAKEILTEDNKGDYTCCVKMMDEKRNALSCHELGLSIFEP